MASAQFQAMVRIVACRVRNCAMPRAMRVRPALWLSALLLLGAFVAAPALAQEFALPAFSSKPAAGGGQTYTLSVQTLLMLTALSFLPSVILLMTSFTRIVIVLSLLRHALGLQSTPSNQVLVGLSLFLTLFVMSPVLDRIYVDAYKPLAEDKISFTEALEKGAVPLQAYMLRQTREADLALFARIANVAPLQDASQVPFKILVPAYVTSELKTAFQIGFLVFLPFMIIDMVVASVLMSMGMMMMSPALISLPFKIMLFVLADGWNLLIGSLVQSFHG
jgi:flagellar biosynthetic protein FliP